MEEIIKPYGYIYLTTNLINGKGYIGKHSVSYHDPKYIGSGGKHFWNAVNKYGRENFINEVLCWCFSEEELNAEEEFLIDFFDCIESDDFYNEREGGKGGWGKGKNHSCYGKPSHNRGNHMTDEAKQKLSESLKKYYSSLSDEEKADLSNRHRWSESRKISFSLAMSGELNPFYGRNHTDETKKVISESKLGKKVPQFSDEHRRKIREAKLNQSEETRRKISESKKGYKYPNRHFNRVCSVCGVDFVSRSNRAKYCDNCNPKNKSKGG